MATQIRTYRLRRDMSVRQLSEECQKLGAAQLTASSLFNIERGQDPNAKRAGRRVLVEELFVLARVLNVPPIMLAFPIGQEDTIRVLPNLVVPTWQAAQWFMGERALTDDPDDFEWEASAAPVNYYREHDAAVKDRLRHQNEPREVVGELDDKLRRVRQGMRRAGVKPPATRSA